MTDYFAFFGVPRKFILDGAALSARFYELSRQFHPDRFQRAPAEERTRALDASATLNDAYRALRDPSSRAEHLLALEGLAIETDRKAKVPPELLEEVFELNEHLDELRSGDQSAREPLAAASAKFEAMLSDADLEIAAAGAAWDASPSREVLEAMRGLLDRRRYIRNLVRDASQLLS